MQIKNKQQIIGSITLIATIVLIATALASQFYISDESGKSTTNPSQPQTSAQPANNNQDSPKYTFYNELKQRKLEIDNSEAEETITATNSVELHDQNKNDNRTYRIQVGAFKTKEDANVIKKRLEKLDLFGQIKESNQRFLVQTKRITGLDQAKKIEQTLQQNKFPTLIKRVTN